MQVYPTSALFYVDSRITNSADSLTILPRQTPDVADNYLFKNLDSDKCKKNACWNSYTSQNECYRVIVAFHFIFTP